jgi:hypothetical protein
MRHSLEYTELLAANMLESIQRLIPWVGTLSQGPKVLLSIVVIALAGFTLAVIWLPQPSSAERTSKLNEVAGAIWPAEKSLEALKRKLDHVSETNAKILKSVAIAGHYGIYASDLSKAVGLPRDEVVPRAKELETDGLIEILALTDLNMRLHEDVTKLLGSNADQFIAAYLK